MQTDSLIFESAGPVNAPPIVFLHGGGVGGWMWQPVIRQLADFYCLSADLPEHGANRQLAPFTIAFAAEKVAEMIRAHVTGGAAHVVGVSAGAQVAVQLLAMAPETARSALISSALLRPLPGLAWLASPALLRWTYRLAFGLLKGWDAWIRLNMKYSAGIPEQYFPQFKADFQAQSEAEFVNLMLANQRFRLPVGLERAAAPALVIAGRKEYAAMQASARDLAAALPHASLAWLDLGPRMSLAQEHNWPLTNPELFAQTLRAWLEGSPLPAPLQVQPSTAHP